MTYDPSSILLTDRVAVITGAGQGIGEACALTFAGFGASLALCDRNAGPLASTAAQITEAGRPALAQVLDVRDRDAVDTFLADVERDYGRVDILVNNAGGTFFSPFVDISENGEAALIAENFTQVTRFVRGVLPMMPDGGAIVNLTSIEAHHAAPGFAIYGAMKAAVAQFTRTLALELGERRIRVNALALDAIPTPGDRGLRSDMLKDNAYDAADMPPLRYHGSPDDAAAAALFLVSDLSRFITGTTVHVDGGNWAAGGWHLVETPE